MAGYFKKRRKPQGPNKNEQKVLRAKDEEDRVRHVGTISSRFPMVRNLRVKLTFLDTRQQALDERSLNFQPSDAALFTISCPGRCGKGSFDLSKEITDAVDRRLAVFQVGAQCLETLYAGSAETCGWEIRGTIELEYLPAPPSPR